MHYGKLRNFCKCFWEFSALSKFQCPMLTLYLQGDDPVVTDLVKKQQGKYWRYGPLIEEEIYYQTYQHYSFAKCVLDQIAQLIEKEVVFHYSCSIIDSRRHYPDMSLFLFPLILDSPWQNMGFKTPEETLTNLQNVFCFQFPKMKQEPLLLVSVQATNLTYTFSILTLNQVLMTWLMKSCMSVM